MGPIAKEAIAKETEEVTISVKDDDGMLPTGEDIIAGNSPLSL